MMKFKFFTALMLVLFLESVSFGQKIDSVQICQHIIRFDSTCIVNKSFQSVKCEEFEMMWLYLVTNKAIQGKSISKDEFGNINYMSGYSLDDITKKGFSIYPKKKDEVIHLPITLKVLGVEMNGYKVELKGKRKSQFYLVFGGNINGKDVGFQVELNKDINSNDDLPRELKKVMELK